MNQILLQADGRLFYAGHAIKADPLGYLGFEVRLAPECTLRSFFRCITRHPQLKGLNPFMDSFVQYFGECADGGCTCDSIDHLALWRTVEFIGHPGPARMELSVSLQGFKGSHRQDIRMWWLENLLDMPLQLGRLHHVVFGDLLNSMKFDTVFNLFELIDGICWQLSFHNLPATCRLTP